jgi:hypothetical protein
MFSAFHFRSQSENEMQKGDKVPLRESPTRHGVACVTDRTYAVTHSTGGLEGRSPSKNLILWLTAAAPRGYPAAAVSHKGEILGGYTSPKPLHRVTPVTDYWSLHKQLTIRGGLEGVRGRLRHPRTPTQKFRDLCSAL